MCSGNASSVGDATYSRHDKAGIIVMVLDEHIAHQGSSGRLSGSGPCEIVMGKKGIFNCSQVLHNLGG